MFRSVLAGSAALLVALAAPATAQQKLPAFGVGGAIGWESGDLAGLDTSGPVMQFRTVKIFETYPVLGIGLDGHFSRQEVDGAQPWVVDSKGAGLLLATMLPLDLFGAAPADAPRGAGIPLYVGYNPIERFDFVDADFETIDAQALRVGMQIPTPWLIGQIEYLHFFFEDGEALPAALGGAELDRSSLQFGVQFPVVLSWHD